MGVLDEEVMRMYLMLMQKYVVFVLKRHVDFDVGRPSCLCAGICCVCGWRGGMWEVDLTAVTNLGVYVRPC